MKLPLLLTTLWVVSSFFNFTQITAQSNFPTDRSDLIVEGEVAESQSVFSEDNKRIYTVHRIDVKRVYKGDLENSFVYVTTFGGQVGDQFQSLSHNIHIGKGTMGIFFLWQNSLKLKHPYSNTKLYFPVDGNDGIIRLFNDQINPPAVFRGKIITHPKVEIYQPLVKETGKVMEINHLTEGFSVESSDPSVKYSFQNAQLSGVYNDTLEFDVYAELIPAGVATLLGNDDEVLFANAKIFVDYDSASFGANLAQSGQISVEKGVLIQHADYSTALSDSTPQKLELEVSSVAHSKNLSLLTENPVQLVHIKVAIANFTEWVLVDFDEISMQSYSDYYDSTNQSYYDFYSVETSGRLRYQTPGDADAAVEFHYELVNQRVIGSNPKKYAFDIVGYAAAPNTEFSDGFIHVGYNTDAFGSSLATNMNVTVTKGTLINDTSYTIFTTDFKSDTVQFLIFGPIDPQSNFVPMPTTPTVLLSVEFEIQKCNEPANLSFNEDFMQIKTAHFTGDSLLPWVAYDPIVASSVDTTLLCPDSLPVIYSLSPVRIPAGTWDTLTISGANFGTDTGTVWFKNADSPSVFSRVYNTDIVVWTDTIIALVVPGTLYPGENSPGKGPVQVKTSVGNVAIFNSLDIPYCNVNDRNSFSLEESRNTLYDTASYVLQLHESVHNTQNAVSTFEAALFQWRCLTGLNMVTVDTSTSYSTISNDTINLVILVDSSFLLTNYGINSLGLTLYSGVDGCDLGDRNIKQLVDVDMLINHQNDWYIDTVGIPGFSQYDFYSVALHELGHAHLLDHALDSTKVMYKSLANSEYHRVLHPDDIVGGREISHDFSTLDISDCLFANTINYIERYPPGCSGLNVENIDPAEEQFTIYPNPTSDLLVVELKEMNQHFLDVYVKIYNLQGAMVYDEDAQKSRFEIDLGDFSAGMYFVSVQIEGKYGLLSKKVVIQK